ncbi:hypothetical protein GFB49_17280 [Epibacterium sp. SM1979]|uniref:Uncharacterized protein n=1 Tax=Tritonibacter litoralis TaxID=2662264 RepID=A0A843YLC8_9RHOB|nr:hypothetical protein [Tritonibacter litoralis]MQQ10224.1 hypothetical protein [Tritonibacter litoralis]
MFKLSATALLASVIASGALAQGNYFESGNWAVVRMGKTCQMFTLRADRHTSGMLSFRFDEQGYNAGFSYEYYPWSNDEGAPWDQSSDYVELYVDDAAVWLGDEMFLGTHMGRDGASMTSGFVGEMIDALSKAKNNISVAVHISAKGETWTYGGFSTDGFTAVAQQAGAMCEFNPSALPAS